MAHALSCLSRGETEEPHGEPYRGDIRVTCRRCRGGVDARRAGVLRGMVPAIAPFPERLQRVDTAAVRERAP
jgi:hypothetical protein